MTGPSPAGPRAALVIALCCAAAVFEGYDLQAPGVTLPDLAPVFAMAPAARSGFLSISSFGLLFGALLGGPLADRIGRRPVLAASVAIFGALSLATCFAGQASELMTARFLTGVGLGGALPNLIAIVAETAPLPRRRGAIGLLYASLPLGGALASLLSAAVPHPEGWRLIYGVGGAVPLGLALLLLLRLPRYPSTRRREAPGASGGVAKALFGEGRTTDTLLLWTAFFFGLIILYLLLGWLPSLLVSRGLGKGAASGVQVAFNLASAATSVAAGRMLDAPRRRRAIVTAFALAAVALVALALAPAKFIVLLAAAAFAGGAVSALQTVIYASAPGRYPAAVRGTGVGVAVAVGRLGSAVGPLLGGMAIAAGGAATPVLAALLPALLISGVASVLLDRRPPWND